MIDHPNTTVCRPVTMDRDGGDPNGFHICPEGDGRIVGPGAEGWEECQCQQKRKTSNANHSHQD